MKRLMTLLVLMFALAPAAVHADEPFSPMSMFVEVESPYGYETTHQMLVDNLKAHGWKSPKAYNWQKILQEEGVSTNPFIMYDICKPQYAAQILQHEELRVISTLMPCATSVYQKSDGKTYVAFLNVNMIGQMFGEKVAGVAAQVSKDRGQVLSFLEE